MFTVNSVWPNWNWKEIASLIDKIAPEVEGLFVDRVIVPVRPEFPQGYVKGEWILRLTGRKAENSLLFSVRPRHAYFALHNEGRAIKAAIQATRSPFDLALSKHLKGLRLVKAHTISRERCVLFDFEGDLRLVLLLIPATPEALLVKRTSAAIWPVIARSRTLRSNPDQTGFFTPPDGLRAPSDLPFREEAASLKNGRMVIELSLMKEAFVIRMQDAEKQIRDLSKQAQDRIRQSKTASGEAMKEPNWQRYGDLLKANMGLFKEDRAQSGNSMSSREVLDYETNEKVIIPCDQKLDVKRQVEKFFQQAQRKIRRIMEAESRAEQFSSVLARLNKNADLLKNLNESFSVDENPDWKSLEILEKSLRGGIAKPVPTAGANKEKRKSYAWLGKSFVSKNGWAIWVGRSKDENLELTFKHAKGNDMWLHVRGRPGSHVVVPVQPGKSVPLDTLLDAAHLVIYFSKGQNWGKTEVDYTFKKYVKRIKDSSEASYTHNKTLIVESDPERIKRLLASEVI